METIVNIAKLKAHLSQFLKRVRSGEEVIITDHNHPIAKLSAFDGSGEILRTRKPTLPIEDLPELLKQAPLKLPKTMDSLSLLLEERKEREL